MQKKVFTYTNTYIAFVELIMCIFTFSVERLYALLLTYGYQTFDPIFVKPDGIIIIREEKQTPQVLSSLFHEHRYFSRFVSFQY